MVSLYQRHCWAASLPAETNGRTPESIERHGGESRSLPVFVALAEQFCGLWASGQLVKITQTPDEEDGIWNQ